MASTRRPWKRLATEQVNPRSARLDRLGVARVVGLMQAEDRRVLSALGKARGTIVKAATAFAQTFRSGGTCFLFGAGTSGRLAVIEAAELPPTFGTDARRVRAIIAGGSAAVFRAKEGAEDRFDEGLRAADRCRRGDLAIGVSASSVTPFVRGALERARQRGAETVLLTASLSPRVGKVANILIRLDTGPEVVAGSTRLKAGTATKLALNQITTSAFASSGKVFGPWMVDLRTGSEKLKDRAVRIVAAAIESTPAKARKLLASAAGEVKMAIVMGRTGDTAAKARERLKKAGGDLRGALAPRGAALRRSAGGREGRPYERKP